MAKFIIDDNSCADYPKATEYSLFRSKMRMYLSLVGVVGTALSVTLLVAKFDLITSMIGIVAFPAMLLYLLIWYPRKTQATIDRFISEANQRKAMEKESPDTEG